jgi:hypothetical protein
MAEARHQRKEIGAVGVALKNDRTVDKRRAEEALAVVRLIELEKLVRGQIVGRDGHVVAVEILDRDLAFADGDDHLGDNRRRLVDGQMNHAMHRPSFAGGRGLRLDPATHTSTFAWLFYHTGMHCLDNQSLSAESRKIHGSFLIQCTEKLIGECRLA